MRLRASRSAIRSNSIEAIRTGRVLSPGGRPLRDDSAGELVDPLDRSLAQQFVNFASTAARRAPLYSALATGIADDPVLFRLLLHAPTEQQLPVLLFACTHHLLLDEPAASSRSGIRTSPTDHRSPADPELMPTFRRFVEARATELTSSCCPRGRRRPTRSAAAVCSCPCSACSPTRSGPLGHIDVGTSGGLNLLLDRYEYRYRADDRGGSRRCSSSAARRRWCST